VTTGETADEDVNHHGSGRRNECHEEGGKMVGAGRVHYKTQPKNAEEAETFLSAW
jgi:hypothetical protein